MAKSTTLAKKPAPAKSPPKAAMERINNVMTRGADAARAGREVDAIIADLRASGDAAEVAEWLETLRDGLAESAEAAAEAVDETEPDTAGRRAAVRAAEALAACRDGFGRALAA